MSNPPLGPPGHLPGYHLLGTLIPIGAVATPRPTIPPAPASAQAVAPQNHEPESDAARLTRLVAELVAQGLAGEAEQLLAEASAGPAEYFCELNTALERAGLGDAADYLIRWQAQQDPGRVFGLLVELQKRYRERNVYHLLRHYSSRPLKDIIALTERFSAANEEEARCLVVAMSQRQPPEIVSVIKIMQESCGIDVSRILTQVADGPSKNMAPFTAALQRGLPREVPSFLRLIVPRWTPATLCSILADLRATGNSALADSLLEAASTQMSEYDLLRFRAILDQHGQSGDAEYVLRTAAQRWDLMTIAKRHSRAEITELITALQRIGFRHEARQLSKSIRR